MIRPLGIDFKNKKELDSMRIDELMEKLAEIRDVHGDCVVVLETSDGFVNIGGMEHFEFDGEGHVELNKG